jgi:hypothetical protein
MASPRTPAAPARARCGRALVALLLALPLAACGDDEDPPPSGAAPPLASPELPSVAEGVSQEGVPQLVNLVVTDEQVTGVGATVAVPLNTPVRLTVITDTADVLLVERYDLRSQLTVGEPVQLELIASEAGDAQVVLERTGQVLTTLQVS